MLAAAPLPGWAAGLLHELGTGSGDLDSLSFCFLRLWNRKREQAITHLGSDFRDINLIRKGKSSMETSDVVLRVDRRHAGVFLKIDLAIDRQDAVLDRDVDISPVHSGHFDQDSQAVVGFKNVGRRHKNV